MSALRSLRPALVALTVLAVLTSAAASGAATSHWHRCPPYNVVTHLSGGLTDTTHLYGLRVERVSCQGMRHVLHGYFFGHTRPVSSRPSDGVWVGSWKVALLMGAVFGDHRRDHFRGQYSDTLN
jgi:hypothetical protein